MQFKSLLLASGVAAALNPSCAPGGNFDLSKWNLQLPTGTPGNPTTIPTSQLQGCHGYQSSVFFTDKSDGSLVMKVPGGPASGCVTTKDSKHCRTEFREQNPPSWSPSAGGNRLKAEVQVTQNGGGTICVGQIHIDDSISVKPVAELYIDSSGRLSMGVQTCRTCGQQPTGIGSVTPGQKFGYEIRYEGNKLSVSINGGTFKELSTYQLDSPKSYFKVGNYNQGDGPTEVHFYSINVRHW